MISLFDANFLIILFDPQARIPLDPKTKKPLVERAQDRITFLVSELSNKKEKIIIPAPALAEFLLIVKESDTFLSEINKKSVFEVVGFNQPEAIELVTRWKTGGGHKDRTGTWAKLKYDRQIVAIAKTHRVEVIYSTDQDVGKLASESEIICKGLADIPLPPPAQLRLKELPISTT